MLFFVVPMVARFVTVIRPDVVTSVERARTQAELAAKGLGPQASSDPSPYAHRALWDAFDSIGLEYFWLYVVLVVYVLEEIFRSIVQKGVKIGSISAPTRGPSGLVGLTISLRRCLMVSIIFLGTTCNAINEHT